MAKALDPATVKHIAYLARITNDPSPEFLEKYGQELGAVLEYLNQLKEVDTAGINALDGARVIHISDLREDEPDEDSTNYQSVRQNIIQNFPNKQGNLLVVAGVFE
jgi:aspartyl-tRNA(Asn)/glutamyl-tRNA(Gln) amidotransferase subunit C